MADGKVLVRERATGQESNAWPVDARELLASGEYEAADAAAEQIAKGRPAFPLTGKARATLDKGKAETATAPVPEHEPEAPAPEPPEPDSPQKRKR